MRRVWIVGIPQILLLAFALTTASARQAPATRTGAIEGVVIDSRTGEPIPEVQIRLGGGSIDPAAFDRLKTTLAARKIDIPQPGALSPEAFVEMVNDLAAANGMALNNPQLQNAINTFRSSNDNRFSTQSDGEGHFIIKNLPPGRYLVQTQREGYFGAAATGNGTRLTAATAPAGGIAAVTLTMTPGATISGRVIAAGMPLANLTVEALEIAYPNGYPVLRSVVSRTTDDRGQYRLYYLPPGDYLIAVTPRNTPRPALANPAQESAAAPAARGEQALRTFYPGTVDRSAAALVSIPDEREVVGVDIPLKTSGLYRVSGEVRVAVPLSVLTTASRPGNNTVRTEMAFVLHDPNVPDDQNGFTLGNVTLQPVGDVFVGAFQANNIPPGLYDWRSAIYETSADGSNQPSTEVVPVEVRGDVEGVRIDIHPTVPLKGVVTVDGEPPGENRIRVSIQVDGSSGKRPGYQSLAARVVLADGKTGAFSLAGVSMGRFHLMVGDTLPTNLYLEDVRSGGESVFDEGFAIGAAEPLPIEVLLRSGAASVSGTVIDAAKKPIGGAAVVLVPAMPQRQNHARFHTATAGPDGAFKIDSVAPGEYKLFAWRNVPAGAYFNAAFLARFEEHGAPVTISGQAAAVKVELKAVSTVSQEEHSKEEQ